MYAADPKGDKKGDNVTAWPLPNTLFPIGMCIIAKNKTKNPRQNRL